MKSPNDKGQSLSSGPLSEAALADKKRLARFIAFLDREAATGTMKELSPLFGLSRLGNLADRTDLYEPAVADAFRRATLRMPTTVTLIEVDRVQNHVSLQQADFIWQHCRSEMRLDDGFRQLDGDLFAQARAVAQEIVGVKLWKCLRHALNKFVFRHCDRRSGMPAEAFINVFEVTACWLAFRLRRHPGAESLEALFRQTRSAPFVVTYGHEWNALPKIQPLAITVFVR